MSGIRASVLKGSGKANPSARDFITHSGRRQVESALVTGLKEGPDAMGDMFASRARDGFVSRTEERWRG